MKASISITYKDKTIDVSFDDITEEALVKILRDFSTDGLHINIPPMPSTPPNTFFRNNLYSFTPWVTTKNNTRDGNS